MALYTQTVMDHFMHPRNVGEIADADGVGEVGNAKCGDIMKMYLKIKDKTPLFIPRMLKRQRAICWECRTVVTTSRLCRRRRQSRSCICRLSHLLSQSECVRIVERA